MSQEIKKILAKNIKELRIKKGLKREELSLLLNFDNSYISKVEKAKVNITLNRLILIANILEVEPYLLLK